MKSWITHIPILGTLANAAAVVAGGTLGLLLRSRLPQRHAETAFQAIGLFTLFLGIHMAAKTQNFLVLIFSLVLGALTGEALNLEKRLDDLAEGIRRRLRCGNDRFVQGFVTAFLLFCTGSMTLLGAIEEGLGGYPNLLFAKSVLDGFSSVALAASLGAGVVAAAVPLLLFQGGITLGARAFQALLSQPVIDEISAVGGILLLGLGLSLLEIRKLRVLNLLPALLYAALLASFLP